MRTEASFLSRGLLTLPFQGHRTRDTVCTLYFQIIMESQKVAKIVWRYMSRSPCFPQGFPLT